jgi:hypothetical protein
MNTRNITALDILIAEYCATLPGDVETLGLFLANRGVLVPSVLTEEQGDHLYREAGQFEWAEELERIAKGA